MSSPFFKLDNKDLVKGLVVAALTAALTTLLTMLQNGSFSLSRQNGVVILTSFVSGGVAYLIKQLGTDAQGKLGGKL